MQHKNKKPADANCEAARQDDAVGHTSTTAERDASALALARLLIYAIAEARELGSEDVAVKIEEACESVKGRFALKDSDILPAETFLGH